MFDNHQDSLTGRPLPSSCYFIATSWGAMAVPDQFRALANELAGRGHQVVVLVDGQQHEAENHHSNPAVYTWPSRRPTRLRDAIFLYKLMRQFRPSGLVANFGATNVMMLVGRLLKVPCRVAWYHTLNAAVDIDGELPRWKVSLLRFRKRLVYDAATHLVAVSDAARIDLQLSYHAPGNKCRVFYNSLADPLAKSSLPSPVKENAVCIGRLRPTKGQDVLLKAMAWLRSSEPSTQVEFIGDGPAKASFVTLAHQLGLDGQCSFLDPISHEAALAKMAAAKVTLVPSRSDNCPLVTIESLAVGTPVIASRVGGIVEIIRDGMDGFLVPPNNPRALARKLKTFMTDAALRDAMGRNARARFLDKFEQNKNVKAQADWLESITAY